MKKETRSHKVNQYPVKRFIGPTVILIVLVAMFITGIYYVLNSYTTDIVTSYLSELAAHDEANIQAYVNDRFRLMRIICQELAAHQPDSVDEVLEELELQARSHSVEAFYLIDQDNKLYSSRRVIHDIKSNPFLRFFDDGEDVVARFDDASKYNENWKEYMFYGISFEDAPLQFTEDGPVFTRMVMLRDTEYIRERMRITSFDGRGYTSIVDANGTFIVSDDSIASQGKFHTCFELIEGQPVWGIEREQILQKFRQGERFTFWYTDANGITKFVLFSPSESSDWTFLTSIEKSVYSDQIQQFVELVAFLMGGLFLIFLVVVVFLFRMTRNKLNAFYSGVVEGAHSRQYYDERVVDAPVTALAVVDVDHLKWINDSHGHLTGDEAIRKMATVLVKRTGSLGKVCRFGGDEFIVAIQQEITEEAFISMIDGIMEDVRAIRLKDSDIPMSLSIGAQYGSGTAGEVFVKADMLLYEAKKTRNRAVVSGREER